MHNLANKIGSKVGEAFKLLKEKETVVNERVEEIPYLIDKLEEVFSNLGLTFSSVKTIEKTPVKVGKITQVTKNKVATPSGHKGYLKMISIHPDFVEIIRDPIYKSEFFGIFPRSVVIENIHAKFLKKSSCVIEELKTKDDNT